MKPNLPGDLRPTEAAPGLHVRAGTRYTSAQGDYVCHCGTVGRANGDTAVKALVDDYTANHGTAHKGRGR